MKRIGGIIAAALLAIIVMAGCSSQEPAFQEGKVNIVTSFFPLYDFARQIGGEHVNVINMIPTGVEPHDWTPKSQDMTNVANAQMFIYQGAGFEGWTDDLLAGIDKENLVVVEASQGVKLIPASEGDKEQGEFDPHTWLSPRSALIMANNIKAGLLKADPEHGADYEANFIKLINDLQALDAKFSGQLSGISKKKIVVTHQAFGYLARDYGLVQLPLMGISAEAEPTAQDLKEISNFIKENEIQYIFTEELMSDTLAKTLAKDLGVRTLPLHPAEGLTEEEAEADETYITIMEKNIANLMTALQ